MLTFLGAILAGLVCGVLSGFGIGGGSLLMVWMTAVLSMDQKAAQGVNLLYFLPTAAMGVVSHARNGLLEKDALRSAIPWGAAAAIAGALVAAAVDTDLLRRPFGIYLLLAAGITLRQLWRDRKG